jgi:uncharacterized damage-inducible protein DinB
MNTVHQIAQHISQLYFGGNWTASNYTDVLADVTHEEAVQSINQLNSIATLLYHTSYYIHAQTQVLEGNPLTASDKESFIHPPIKSELEWETMKKLTFDSVKKYLEHIKSMPEETLHTNFYGDAYGSWLNNLMGLLEHNHYHLGQIVVIKKLLRST